MKTTDFATYLSEFFKVFMPGQRDLSQNTIMSYRDTFRFLLVFCEKECAIPAERITLNDFTGDLIARYLKWLETERTNSDATKRQRLAAIHAFVRFLKTRTPQHLLEFEKILEIKIRRTAQSHIKYLSPNDMETLLHAPDVKERFGRRDMVLLALMYDSGARVQEICDLQVGDIRLSAPAVVKLKGKGCKTRVVPLMRETADAVKTYLSDNKLDSPGKHEMPAFFNHRGEKLTRAGVTYILNKYCRALHRKDPLFPEKLSPHQLRHSKAMHMLKAGSDLIYIRDFLGHNQIATTEVYAKADTDMKREAVEKASLKDSPELPDWREDESLMSMLVDLCR